MLEVRDLRIESRIGGSVRTIVSGVDVTVAAGETVGIVGESGSGKSMTARAIVGVLPPGVHAHGSVLYGNCNLLGLSERARNRLRGDHLVVVFQDPFTMLNPLMRCGYQIAETLRTEHGQRLSRSARRAETLRRLTEVGIRDRNVADRYPFQLSGGMRQRVGLAAALAGDPRVLIADEPTTALDVTTQREILALIKSLQDSRRMGLLLITHDLRVAFSICDRVYVLYAGSLLEVADARRLEAEPLHPYTLGLLLSEPPADRRLSRLVAIPGSVASFDEVAGRCPFAPRCEWMEPRCTADHPPLVEVEPDRRSACVRLNEIRTKMKVKRQAAEREAHSAVRTKVGEALIEVDELAKVFPGRARGHQNAADVHALKGVTIQVGKNESVGVVGESGSGKTTLARCLVGLETPTSGRIVIGGVDASNFAAMSSAERRQVRKTVQIIFQDPYSSLNPVRTVGATLKEALAPASGRARNLEGQVIELLAQVGLPAAYARRKPAALSGGERQRVAIARTLAVRPSVIICDEPASALDVSVQAQILNLFQALQAELGVSYLFITHDLAVVRQVVSRVYVLYGGEVVETGPVDDILDRPRHAYTAKLVESVPRAQADWVEEAPTSQPPERGA